MRDEPLHHPDVPAQAHNGRTDAGHERSAFSQWRIHAHPEPTVVQPDAEPEADAIVRRPAARLAMKFQLAQ